MYLVARRYRIFFHLCGQVVSSIESGESNARQYQSNIDGWAVDIIEVRVNDYFPYVQRGFCPRVEKSDPK